MKIKNCMLFGLLILAVASNAATGIQAKASVSSTRLNPGETVTVPVTVDFSGLSENLGSYTAALHWDASVLEYVSAAGASGPFANPVINDRAVAEGRLSFAAANPGGARSKAGLINVTFKVIGQGGASAGLGLEFTAMAAAKTFKDLLPELQVNLEDLTVANALPTMFSLSQNHPNPFNPTTRIEFSVPEDTRVRVEIYNLLGEKVRTLVDAEKEAGNHTILWDSKDSSGIEMPAGVYLIQMNAGSFSDMKKMMLVK